MISLTGAGFWSPINGPIGGFGLLQTMSVQVCGQPCAVNTTASTSTTAQCTVPELVTAASIDTFLQADVRIGALSGTVSGLNVFNGGLAFDGSLETVTQDSYWYERPARSFSLVSHLWVVACVSVVN